MNSDQQLKMQYLGTLGLLANCSVQLKDGPNGSADELRGLIEQALIDAQVFIPYLHWRRVLDSFEISLVDS